MSDLGTPCGIGITGIDVGYLDYMAYAYMDSVNNREIVALRGEKEEQYISLEKDTPYFRLGKAHKNYYLLSVGFIKDDISEYMQLNWNKQNDIKQPNNFMNYPIPEYGLYLFENFFGHYESEERKLITKKDGNTEFRWVKKVVNGQNHLWDCRVYNMALRDIEVYSLGVTLKSQR